MNNFEYEVDMIIEAYLSEFKPVYEIGDTPAGQAMIKKSIARNLDGILTNEKVRKNYLDHTDEWGSTRRIGQHLADIDDSNKWHHKRVLMGNKRLRLSDGN